MSYQSYHSEEEQAKQLPPQLGDLWETEIVPRLPAMLEEKASEYKAQQRTRAIAEASDLLRALLARVLARWSFRQLGCWATLLGIAAISEGAWRKRVRKSGEWLQWLLCELMERRPPVEWQQRPAILLVDGTSLRAEGGSGDDWRVQLVYDLSAGHLQHVMVGDCHQAETLVGVPGEAGEIFLADRKYGTRANLLSREEVQASLLSRFSPQLCRLEEEDGTKIEVMAWLQEQSEEQEMLERDAQATIDSRRVAVRLLAWRLPKEVANRKREKILVKAKRNGKTVRPQTLYLAGWVLLVTTLAVEDWPARDLFWLYRHRWQIELLIKRLKQFLLLVELRCQRPEEVRATLLAALVAWMLIEEEGQELLRALEWGQQSEEQGLLQAYLPLLEHWEKEDTDTRTAALPMPTISVWTVMSTGLSRWRALVIGQWSLARVLALLPQLARYFCPGPRRRLNQRLVFQAWVHQRLRAGAFLGGLG